MGGDDLCFRLTKPSLTKMEICDVLESVRVPADRRSLVGLPDAEPTGGHSETALLSEQSLAEDWNRPEEGEAWFHLQQA